ncbi:MAG TPA: ATP-binding protein [Streptosporangiaceae bacterium]|nr:ATP-binding protein [Streptosporangiaceae bacterium]
MTATPQAAAGGASSGPAGDGSAQCSAEELHSLFLFEKLTDDQLAWLCAEGRVERIEPGLVYSQGDPATCFYVLLSGEVVLLQRVGGDEIEVHRASSPGVYAGAFYAYLGDRVRQVYNNSMRATVASRFFVLDAEKFAELMTEWFPMAAHLLEGLLFGHKNTQEAIGQRERLLALGTLTAGLAHELNNPAAAAVRATATLRERVAGMRGKLGAIAARRYDNATMEVLIALQNEAAERVSKAPALSPLEASDAEDEVTDWLEDHGIEGGWQLAPIYVQGGLDRSWLDRVEASVADSVPPDGVAAALDGSVRWIAYTIESELLMNEIDDSTARISALVGAAKQYSQLDRAPFQVTDVHELLDSTLMMLGGKIGPDITVVRDYDRSVPDIPCFPGELNQVWTNLIDNAVSAMGTAGTLTIRTARERDQVLVEIGDTGPGVAPEIQDRIFEPFFTTKPVGQGTGLGLDISWRIVVNAHHGDLRVVSEPGDTRFQVRLPLAAPAGAEAAGPQRPGEQEEGAAG